MHDLQVEKLTREAFAPFGDVIETEEADNFEINNGTTNINPVAAGIQYSEML